MSYKSFRILITSLSLMLFAGTVLAQNGMPVENKPAASAEAVTASVEGTKVRFASAGQVLQTRLEIYGAAGDLLFDSGLRAGSVIDWNAADSKKPVTDGTYLVVVTVRDFNNKFGQRLGALVAQAGQLTLKADAQPDVTAAQSQAINARRKALKIEPVGSEALVTVLRAGKERSAVVAGHDGQNGQLTSTSGALTLRTGDFFAGTEKEQVRVTNEGRVGIGTTNPQATLDVAGTIAARDGIRFGDGTVLTSANALKGTTTNVGVVAAAGANASGSTVNAVGSGTTGKLSKWTDDLGTLGDSVIAEQTGNVGIGTATPKSKLHVVGAIEIGNATPTGINPTISNPRDR